MRMMLVGAGAVGESILKVMQWRDQKGEWLKYVLVCDYDLKRAEEVVGMMKGCLLYTSPSPRDTR